MNICLSCEGVTATTAKRCGHCGAFLLPLDDVHFPTRRGEADAGHPMLGAVVDGKYRLEGVLGRGGLGTVFQAEHAGSLMKVAVKLLHPRFSERPEYQKALLPEARRAATVTNERCARLLDVGETADGGTYLAMELVDGDTLDTLVKSGPVAPSHAVDILVDIAEALVAIHEVGLVHCDLAPRNVMVSQRSSGLVAKVLDFGIARSVSVTAGERLEHGEFRGFANPAFSAPEQLAGQDVDPRADLYSLGALGWFLLTGKPPIEEGDSSRAARAAVAGELVDWPGVSGVPRRLQRLLQRCLALDPGARPVSAAAVRRELITIAGTRRPALTRLAVFALAVAAVLTVAVSFAGQEAYLQSVGGPLVLSERTSIDVVHLQSRQLETVQLRFGGFRADRLRLDIARDGTVLRQWPLGPQVDANQETLTLSVAQPEWQRALQSILDSSRDNAVDLTFVVPGRPPLGTCRVRLDDDPPALELTLNDPDTAGISAGTVAQWQVDDRTGLVEARLVVELEGGRTFGFDLPVASAGGGEVALGRDLATRIDEVRSSGSGAIRIVAADLAGNVANRIVHEFDWLDVRAPSVQDVTGPTGEDYLPSVSGRIRMRVQLSAPEPGSRLVVRNVDGSEVARRQLEEASVCVLEIDADAPEVGPPSASKRYEFEVVDPVGNRSTRTVTCAVRDSSIGLQFLGDGLSFVTVGEELVIGPDGADATLRCSPLYRVATMRIESENAAAQKATIDFRAQPGTTAVTFGSVPPGRHRLAIELTESAGDGALRVREWLPLRVLPPAIEVHIAPPASRFLAGLVRAGVLAEAGDGYREGNGWGLDPDLRTYVRGSVWTGFTLGPIPLPMVADPSDPLLPELRPLPGHNVLALDLVDVLDRDVRVLVGDAAPPRRLVGGRSVDVIAEFFWHNEPPVAVGEELLVEHGQPARLRLRFPLPYDERDALRLSLSENELLPVGIESEGAGDDRSIATYEIPFEIWRSAAGLVDTPRERFADQLQRPVEISVETPVERYDLRLSLRTTRSTLRAVELGELADVPAALADLRLLPLLAPTGPFPEPVPDGAPPRALYRPQVAAAVRNIHDLVLQDRELTAEQAVAIVDVGLARRGDLPASSLVHVADPLQHERLTARALLPESARRGRPGAPLTGIDFYQAYTLCRLLGVAVAGDPELFRLPFGVELELAAFGTVPTSACNGPAARGQPVSMPAFRAARTRLSIGRAPTVAESLRAGDVAPGAAGGEFVGLDFGVREWVGDLPHVPEQKSLLEEWIGDHESHVARVAGFADGTKMPPAELAGPLRTFGVVRGLALGEVAGLLAASGQRLEPMGLTTVPASVPGVLRSEQLRRDGRDLLADRPDPRLQVVGLRVAGTTAFVARLRGLE